MVDEFEQQRLGSLLGESSEGLWIITFDLKVTVYNKTFYADFNIDVDNPTIHDWFSLVHVDDKSLVQAGMDDDHEAITWN